MVTINGNDKYLNFSRYCRFHLVWVKKLGLEHYKLINTYVYIQCNCDLKECLVIYDV